jgi:hypothetical protein
MSCLSLGQLTHLLCTRYSMAALVPLLLAFGLVARSSPVTDEAGERVSLAGDRASADALRLLVDHRNATSGVDVLQTFLEGGRRCRRGLPPSVADVAAGGGAGGAARASARAVGR